SVEDTGSELQVGIARKELSDFVKRSNMHDVNIETTRFASVCGYAGRLLYIDEDGKERARHYPPFETIILSETEITEPSYAVHVYPVTDINGHVSYKAEFFDENNITFFEGELGALRRVGEPEMHCFDYCPLQGIPNNLEMMGDAEKVIDLIDNYDSNFSDNANDIEGFANAYMVFKNCSVDDGMMDNANATGVIGIMPDDENAPYDVSFLTKNIQDSFVSSHLDRTEDNIYRFSRTPNLNDPEFNASSGIALKLKMTGLETKTATFEAKQESADRYMFKVLESSFAKRKIAFDYLQCSIQYNRNFPVDFTGDAQAVQALIAAGLPKQIAFKALSFIDDIDYVMNLIEEEKDGVEDLDEPIAEQEAIIEDNVTAGKA
ncbi:MAG: phage portal protein, partial [Lachnospiraceae bacterium]